MILPKSKAEKSAKAMEGKVQEALDAGYNPSDILSSMLNAMDIVGEKFIEAAEDPAVNIVGASALLTTIPALRDTVAALSKCSNRSQFKIMIGGAPVTQEFATEIGADVYTEDAASAAQKAKSFLK